MPVVLLVEDHVDTREMYAEFLRASFEILEAGDGSEAIELARQRPPSVVVTDLSLPGMDGFELIAHLRRQPATRTVPMVCLSGYSGLGQNERAREAGFDLIIQKPCLPDALGDAIRELLSGAQPRRHP
jgi:CheY-like chemotaxis protein